MSIDFFFREIMVIGDQTVTQKMYSIRIIGFSCFSLLILLRMSSGLKSNPFMFKKILIGLMILRVVSNLLECFLYFREKDIYRMKQIGFEMAHRVSFDSFFLNCCGIFYFKDLFFHNILSIVATLPVLTIYLEGYRAYLVYLMAMTMANNLIDVYFHSKREIDSFNNLIKIERKSLHLSQFVNRLLPKHVKS
jgi:hypothetical protein